VHVPCSRTTTPSLDLLPRALTPRKCYSLHSFELVIVQRQLRYYTMGVYVSRGQFRALDMKSAVAAADVTDEVWIFECHQGVEYDDVFPVSSEARAHS